MSSCDDMASMLSSSAKCLQARLSCFIVCQRNLRTSPISAVPAAVFFHHFVTSNFVVLLGTLSYNIQSWRKWWTSTTIVRERVAYRNRRHNSVVSLSHSLYLLEGIFVVFVVLIRVVNLTDTVILYIMCVYVLQSHFQSVLLLSVEEGL